MSCYHPLVGIWKGEYTANGKKKYQIEGNLNPMDCPSTYDHIVVPCGHCIGCRLDYSRSWADRMMLELEIAGKGLFVTLTYDNDHIPVSEWSNDLEPLNYTLDKRDCQLWMKRLRREYSDVKIRFYLAGEYGENTGRPHYHCILFGIGLDDVGDLVPHGRNELGQQYYICPRLSKTWSRGFVLVSDVSWKTCAYVARYVTKKLSGPDSLVYAVRNQEKEFSLMSRKPGIGKEYLDKNPDCLDYENINISTPEGGLKIRIPKYYLRQLQLTDPERYDKIMEERKSAAEDAMILKLGKTSLSYLDYLEVEEEKKISQLKGLPKRNKVY